MCHGRRPASPGAQLTLIEHRSRGGIAPAEHSPPRPTRSTPGFPSGSDASPGSCAFSTFSFDQQPQYLLLGVPHHQVQPGDPDPDQRDRVAAGVVGLAALSGMNIRTRVDSFTGTSPPARGREQTLRDAAGRCLHSPSPPRCSVATARRSSTAGINARPFENLAGTKRPHPATRLTGIEAPRRR